MEYRSSKSRLNDYKEYKLNEIEKDVNYCHPMRKHEKEYLDEEAEKIRSEKLYYWSGWNIYDWLIIFILFITIILHIVPVALYNNNPNFDPDEDLVDNNVEGFSGGIEIVRDDDGYLEDVICHAPTDEVHFDMRVSGTQTLGSRLLIIIRLIISLIFIDKICMNPKTLLHRRCSFVFLNRILV